MKIKRHRAHTYLNILLPVELVTVLIILIFIGVDTVEKKISSVRVYIKSKARSKINTP
jgi:hypothetical protein